MPTSLHSHGVWDTDELYDLQTDPHEPRNLILDPAHRDRVAGMRTRLHQQLAATNGLHVPLGFKRGPGSNLRNPQGSPRAEFPATMLHPSPNN